MSTPATYHHKNLPSTIINAALDVIAESGPSALSLRDLARRAGVSHAAPAHHFRDKAGLLTAVAVQGFGLLADALAEAQQQTGDFLEVGVAYVGFAVGHPAHFAVMFRPELYRADDPELIAAKALAGESLRQGVAPFAASESGPASQDAALAAWSLVHGFATLWLSGNLPAGLPADPREAARHVASVLFAGRG
ncbi:AcrR family transcriptional regulator [Arthrobacter sp. V1I9]|uniref:TetR/AcrR family transcriptional regulator n=1 Tax=Arthrobacter sp. V1I9 TaxID=3042275 RepID=UPI00278E3E27|nr:TetR/AcrR family transcriptional regulator [Arthrobacter sp. V1I9]MDQ0868297.1 AcrR family transcriptional regulator [Arthrobacter sp. V1I9]